MHSDLLLVQYLYSTVLTWHSYDYFDKHDLDDRGDIQRTLGINWFTWSDLWLIWNKKNKKLKDMKNHFMDFSNTQKSSNTAIQQLLY